MTACYPQRLQRCWSVVLTVVPSVLLWRHRCQPTQPGPLTAAQLWAYKPLRMQQLAAMAAHCSTTHCRGTSGKMRLGHHLLPPVGLISCCQAPAAVAAANPLPCPAYPLWPSAADGKHSRQRTAGQPTHPQPPYLTHYTAISGRGTGHAASSIHPGIRQWPNKLSEAPQAAACAGNSEVLH
jgi:hypothetical protein